MEPIEFIIYGRSGCASCVAAVNFLEAKGMKVLYLDVGADPRTREEMFKRVNSATGSDPRTVPQIFSDSFGYIGGFDQLTETYDQLYGEIQG